MDKQRMPKPTQTPAVSPRVMQSLSMDLDQFLRDENAVRKEYPWAERFVMGLPLAPWQRGFKWTTDQSQRFITSAWTGVPLGTYVLTAETMMPGREIVYAYLANCVLEGQQRLRALELYLTDALAVPDANGVLCMWSDVGRLDRLRFMRTIFSRGTVQELDEHSLREYYNLMNFGGTGHEESESA